MRNRAVGKLEANIQSARGARNGEEPAGGDGSNDPQRREERRPARSRREVSQ
jgi:hypothetical protein